MVPFDLRKYFKDLGNGWRVNTITGSIFFENEEVVVKRNSARVVLINFLKKQKEFKICPFLKKNFEEVLFVRDRHYLAVWAKAMYLVLEKLLNQYGFTIEVMNGLCSKKAEWRLCYVNQ